MKRLLIFKLSILACLYFALLNPDDISYAQSQDDEWKRALALFQDAQNLFNLSDCRGALEKWAATLPVFQKLGRKQAVRATLSNLGNAYYCLGDYRKAIGYFEQSLTIAEEIGDNLNKANNISNLAMAYRNLGDHQKAITYYEKALAFAEASGDKKGRAASFSDLGKSYYHLSDYNKAIGYFEQAMTAAVQAGDAQGAGTALSSLGIAYRALGDYRKAISYFEQSLAISEMLGDKLGKGSDLSNLGNCYYSLGDYRKATAYLDQALAIADQTGNRRIKGAALVALGNICSDSGDYRKAIVCFEQSLVISNETGDKRSKGTATGNLGIVYAHLGDYPKAISHFEQALSVMNEIGDKYNKGLYLGSLGNIYETMGDYQKAIGYLEQALAIAREIGDKQGISANVNNIGAAYSNLGDYEKALLYYEKVIDLVDNTGINYLVTLGNLGDVCLALDLDEKALDIYKKINHPVRLGRYYLKKKDYLKAKEQFNRGREDYEKARVAEIIIAQWIGLGLACEGLSEYEDAYRWYKRAVEYLEDQRATLSPAEKEHYLEGKIMGIPKVEAYEGAARCAFMLNRMDEAFFWAENTRGRIFSEILSRRHSSESYKVPAELIQRENEITSQIMINRKQQETAYKQNNHELQKQLEDEHASLKGNMDKLVDLLRRDYPQYASIHYPQPIKPSQIAFKKGETVVEYEVTGPYTIGLVLRDGKVVQTFKVEKTRSELEALVQRFRFAFREGADPREFSLKIAGELADILIKPVISQLQKDDHLIIIADKCLNLLPFESLPLTVPVESLQAKAGEQPELKQEKSSAVVTRGAIIRNLSRSADNRAPTNPPLVSTHILFDTNSDRIRNESQKQLEEITAALNSQELKNMTVRIEGHTDSAGDSSYNLRLSLKRARAVRQYLVKSGIRGDRISCVGKGDTEPIADNSTDSGKQQNRRVNFVRVLGKDEKLQSPSSQGVIYAIDKYQISYYQSAVVLSLQRRLQASATKELTFFGVGDPIFNSQDQRSAKLRSVIMTGKNKDYALSSSDYEDSNAAGYSFGRLENTAKEVTEVSRIFGKSKILLGADASKENVKREDLKPWRYILFSTHGVLGNEIPYIKQPALVFNLVGNRAQDGFLTTEEIFSMDLAADLVGLSACNTGLGIESSGEGVVGLSRAFMYAGTKSVLVSLWSVADESTYKLMVRFFEELKLGKDKLTALKDAKHYLRTNGFDNPFYWAPFILVGEAD